MSFIKLTELGNKQKVRVNIETITYYNKSGKATFINFAQGVCICIKETPEEIDKLIEDANNPKPISFVHNPEARKTLDLSEIVRIRKNTSVMKPLQ